jgi:hypothetical protein
VKDAAGAEVSVEAVTLDGPPLRGGLAGALLFFAAPRVSPTPRYFTGFVVTRTAGSDGGRLMPHGEF